MENINKANNKSFGTFLKWGLGITVAYNLLPEDAKENIGKFLYQVNYAMVASQRRKAELERQQQMAKIIDDYASRPEILALFNPKPPVQLSVPLTSVASPPCSLHVPVRVIFTHLPSVG